MHILTYLATAFMPELRVCMTSAAEKISQTGSKQSSEEAEKSNVASKCWMQDIHAQCRVFNHPLGFIVGFSEALFLGGRVTADGEKANLWDWKVDPTGIIRERGLYRTKPDPSAGIELKRSHSTKQNVCRTFWVGSILTF